MRRISNRSRWFTALCVGFASASVAGCRPTKTTTAPASEEDGAATAETGDDGDPAASATKSATPSEDESPTCGDQGKAWDGSHSGCVYEHAGCCYPDPAALCVAAGCPDDTCQILESRPAQATCG
ncbi:MAG: hypothetical protein JKY37_13515 [Nannocystaceae bacterium]|nr:hypothetical protein [Nannocystaceae bacterium]